MIKSYAGLLNPVSPRSEKITIFFLRGTTENFYFYPLLRIFCKWILITSFIKIVIIFFILKNCFLFYQRKCFRAWLHHIASSILPFFPISWFITLLDSSQSTVAIWSRLSIKKIHCAQKILVDWLFYSITQYSIVRIA